MTAKRNWIYDLLLIAILLMAAYFRVLGLNWDENQHLHPDERFLTMVETALQPRTCSAPGIPVEACPDEQKTWISPSLYFNTAESTMNPQNRGYGFFVYGTLPIFLVRYLAELLGQNGYDQVHLVGRLVSAVADLGVIVLLFLISARLYGRKVGYLAAAFSALAVMQIQQSHFFTVDNPANFFTFLAILFAVLIATNVENPQTIGNEAKPEKKIKSTRDSLLLYAVGFGISLGMAVASKLNAAPLALLLPAAFAVRYYMNKPGHQPGHGDQPEEATTADTSNSFWTQIALYLVCAAAAAGLTFRIFQPYAFAGIGLNTAWLGNLNELRAQSSGDVDVPFALQWARRSHLYSFQNMTTWGLGLPLGILAWLGFILMGWRAMKGERRHLLLWGWTAFYFGWQSLAFNPTMRYQLPIYPLLCMMAAWLIFDLLERAKGGKNLWRAAAITTGALVLLSTLAWAYAFTRIYTRAHTRVAATHWIYQNLPGAINIHITDSGQSSAYGLGYFQQPLSFPYDTKIRSDAPFTTGFAPKQSGSFSEVLLAHLSRPLFTSQTLTVSVASSADFLPEQLLAFKSISLPSPQPSEAEEEDRVVKFDQPVPVVEGQTYFLRIDTNAELSLGGAAPINESSWDDGLPLRMDGFDGFGGLYNGALNFEMYWDDNLAKLDRFVSMLDQGDYIFITSNRQWASVTRIPERFPLTTQYYRLLIGCPDGQDVIWCYNVAQPRMFNGRLGYELEAVFESFPSLELPGLKPIEWNDQFAEEAFTVYDHPKVLIFKKSQEFNSGSVRAQLSEVDLSGVVHLTPKNAGNYKNLMLSADQLSRAQAAGTWSDLFDYDWIQNKFPLVGVVIWYLFIFILGLSAYPLARLALPGLGDRGYAVSRTLGLALLGYIAWFGGSIGIPYTRISIGVIFALLAAGGMILGWNQREQLRSDWKSKRSYYLTIEIIFLAFFILDLLIRIGNPDLWHPAKGGERPMDFSYFNAILKGTSFPPYDPWFAGGYINYYYYGYVLVGTPVKLLGIVPSIAYNLILPTLFALVAIGAFAIGWNFNGTKAKFQLTRPGDKAA